MGHGCRADCSPDLTRPSCGTAAGMGRVLQNAGFPSGNPGPVRRTRGNHQPHHHPPLRSVHPSRGARGARGPRKAGAAAQRVRHLPTALTGVRRRNAAVRPRAEDPWLRPAARHGRAPRCRQNAVPPARRAGPPSSRA